LDYLLVSPDEMEVILADTGCRVERFIAPDQANYFAVIRKQHYLFL